MNSLLRHSLWLWILFLAGCAAVLPRVNPPYVSLSDLRVTNIGVFEQRYTMKLRIQNPNDFKLPITGMDFTVSFNDIEFGRGVSRQNVTVPAYGEAQINVDMVSNLGRLVDQLKELELGGGAGLRYRLVGGLSVANRTDKIPFEYFGEVGRKQPQVNAEPTRQQLLGPP